MDKNEFTLKINEKINNKAKHLTKDQMINCHKAYIDYHEKIKSDEILVIPMEEMAELMQHLSKIIRKKENIDDIGILEEMADVQICIDNLKLYFGIDEDTFKYAMDVKFERSSNKIKNGNA